MRGGDSRNSAPTTSETLRTLRVGPAITTTTTTTTQTTTTYTRMMILVWFLLIGAGKLAEGRLRIPRQAGHHEGGQRVGSVPLTYDPPSSSSVAICKLVSSAGHNVRGDIVFRQANPQEAVEITGVISGLSPGYHGFHVHQNADLSDNCKAAGPHFNPEQVEHGAPYDSVRHVGDLGNIPADADGYSTFQFMDKEITLFEGSNNQIIGKSIVVHAMEDDLGRGGTSESKKTGNAGPRAACCVIEPVNQYYHN